MKFSLIPRSAALPLTLCLLFAAPLTSFAQMDGPPAVLVSQREFLKPGKAGSLHERTESAFVKAMTEAKSTSHYFGMDSMSGPSRALYFSPYPSVAAWEQDNKTVQKNVALSAALDRAVIADGELLTSYDQTVFAHREDLSFNEGNLIGKRYFEIGRWEIKPGHGKEFEELVKLYMDGTKKAGIATNWATYEIVYGVAEGDVFIAITTLKTLAEADAELASNKQFADAIGEDGMKRIRELTRSAVKTQQTNLYAINPKMSFPPEEWIKAEPEFWKPKAPAAPKLAAAKPAAAPAAKLAN